MLVLPEGADNLDLSKPIGCSSQRRILQLQQMYPEATFKYPRKCADQIEQAGWRRVQRADPAAAGLKRLGLEERISRYYEPDEVIPAAGQGFCSSGTTGRRLFVYGAFCRQRGNDCSAL